MRTNLPPGPKTTGTNELERVDRGQRPPCTAPKATTLLRSIALVAQHTTERVLPHLTKTIGSRGRSDRRVGAERGLQELDFFSPIDEMQSCCLVVRKDGWLLPGRSHSGNLPIHHTQKQLSPLAIEVCNERTGCKDAFVRVASAPRGVPVSMANAHCGGEHPAVRRLLW